MSPARSPRHRRTPPPHDRPRTILLLAALLTGGCLAVTWTTIGERSPTTAAPPPTMMSAADVPTDHRAPARIDIPVIGVTADVEALLRNGDGSLDTPDVAERAGWYAEGIAPGELGPAVVVGHRDLGGEPAVFDRLADLAPGDQVMVTGRDGGATRFVVEAVAEVAKAEFPTRQVYGLDTRPLLRLITCSGSFDDVANSYQNNLIVTATAV